MREWWWMRRYIARHWVQHRGVMAGHWFGKHFPKGLAYWVVMGLWVRSTTGDNGDMDPSLVTAHDLLLVSEGQQPEGPRYHDCTPRGA